MGYKDKVAIKILKKSIILI